MFLICGAMLCGFLFTMHWISDAVPPSPFDVKANPDRAVEIVEQNLKSFYARTQFELARKRMTKAQADHYFRTYAAEQAARIDKRHLTDGELYRFGESLRSGRKWRDALEIFQRYLETGSLTEDFRVNTLLRIAQCQAELGETENAIKSTRSTFDAESTSKPAILLAVYLEIVPPMRGKADSLELTELVKEAMVQHALARVNRRSEAGRTFLMARDYHYRQAAKLITELALEAGDLNLATESMSFGGIPDPPKP
jgi:hypothetical protein